MAVDIEGRMDTIGNDPVTSERNSFRVENSSVPAIVMLM
jgi:hypothetical protein